jgi:hypothetical protein
MLLKKVKEGLIRARYLPSNIVLIMTYFSISLIVTVVWFGHGQFLIYTDTNFPLLNLPKYTERSFSVLDSAFFPHSPDIRHLFLYPYASYFPPLNSLWSPFLASLAQHIFQFLTLFFAFVSVHLFLNEINRIGKLRIEPLAILIVSLIYVFNVYAATAVWRPFITSAMLHYAFFPMFIALSIRYFTTGDRKKYLIGLLLISWIIFPSYNTIPTLFFDALILAALFISIKNLCKKTWIGLTVDFAAVSMGMLILSIPLLLVILSSPSLLSKQYEQLSTYPVSLSVLLPFNSPSIEKAFFFSGYPPFYLPNPYGGGFYHFMTKIIPLEPLLLIFIGGLICIGTLTVVKNKATYLIVFPLIWMFLMFFFTGSNNPFSNAKILAFQYVFKEAFRSVYVRFGEPLLLVSIPLIYIGIIKLFSLKIPKLNNNIISLLLISIFLLSSFPILQGSFLEKQSNMTPSDQVNFPDSYVHLLHLNGNINTPNFLYITIPPWQDAYNIKSWKNGTEGYVGPDLLPFILKGETITQKRIFENIMGLIIEGKSDLVQKLLPLKYIIVTFDQADKNGKRISHNYYTLLKKHFNSSLIYNDPNHLAIFELPENSNQLTISNKSKQVFILGKENIDTEVVKKIFLNSVHTIISHNTPVEDNYNLTRLIAGVIDFNEIKKLKVLSEVRLNPLSKGNVFFPIFMEFPNVTERIFVGITREPKTAQWNISAGFWSADSMKWIYIPVYFSHSNKLTLLADFSRNYLSIEDNLTATKVPMPKEWMDIISSRITRLHNSESNYGTIGAYSTTNLSSSAQIDLLQIKRENDNNTAFLPYMDNKTPLATIRNVSRISPSLFRVNVDSSGPFTIALADSYDSSWIASVNQGEKISSVPIYGINGFFVNQTGQLNITIEYEPQKWFDYGTIIAEIIFLISLVYVLFVWMKNSHSLKQIMRVFSRISGNSKGDYTH